MVKPEFFRRIGILFFPTTIIGWLVAAASAAFCVYLFIDIDSRSHSVSDTLINFVFNALIVGVVYSIIAFYFSKEK
jgi:hypothetical protein